MESFGSIIQKMHIDRKPRITMTTGIFEVLMSPG